MAEPNQIAILFLFVSLCSILSQVAQAEDLIWYKPNDGNTGHQYAWHGTTDGKSAPEALISSVINQPWLVSISKTKNIIYWTDNQGVIGAWSVSTQQSSIIYKLDIGSWNEKLQGPALTGLDLDELNNHLYYTFDTSIYRLDLSQANPSPISIATYGNLVFNPRFSASRNSLFFWLRNRFFQQGDLVQVSLTDPAAITILVGNASAGSIEQQLFIDETSNTLYYNSAETSTMRGVSLVAPYTQVFQSIPLGAHPTFFDLNPTTKAFVYSNWDLNAANLWYAGSEAPTVVYESSRSSSKVTGVKFYNDTHVVVAYQNPGDLVNPSVGYLVLVNINNPKDTLFLLQHFSMGHSLIFDEKTCDLYYVLNLHDSDGTHQRIMRKHVNASEPSLYSDKTTYDYSGMGGITLDPKKRNLIVSNSLMNDTTSIISYFSIDQPSSTPVQLIDSKGRSIKNYIISDKTGDIFYLARVGIFNEIYRLKASAITKDWINNVGARIIGPFNTENDVHMTVDSVRNKFYLTFNASIVQSNLDGSDMKIFFTLSDAKGLIKSMKWDPSSNRLFFLASPTSGWILGSVNDDGANYSSAPLNASLNTLSIASVNPDRYSDWVYINSPALYQPLRVKKDGSKTEHLFSYTPINQEVVTSLSFDEATGSLYYADYQCTIKKIDINNVHLDTPETTPFEVSWQGDDNTCSQVSFIHDRTNKVFWLLQSNQGSNYSVAVTPVNGGPTKQLFAFPQHVNSPFAIDTKSGKMFASHYITDNWSQRDRSIVAMDLYNGSNLVTLKYLNGSSYNGFSMTALTYNSQTQLLYYGLDSPYETALESFSPFTLRTERIWYVHKRYNILVLKIKGSLIYMATFFGNILAYDLNSGTITDKVASATAISLDPNSDNIYLAAPSVLASAKVNDVNATQITLLKSFKIFELVFDFDSRFSYFTLQTTRISITPPYYYRADLDGTSKKRLQVQGSFYVPGKLNQLSFVNGKFYAANENIDSFKTDGSDYTRIMQSVFVKGNLKYDEVSQRVYWQEAVGSRFFSCAVYSNKYADCRGYQLFSEMQYTSYATPQLCDFAIGKNGLVYFTDMAQKAIYRMDTDIGVSSLSMLVQDPRLAYINGITMNKTRSALYVTTIDRSQSILRVDLNGAITTLYSGVASNNYILSTDLTHCK